MNLPLATDNLYKFLALSGLAIFLLLPIYYFDELHKRNINKVQTEMKVLMLGEDLKILEYELDQSEKNNKEIIGELEKLEKSQSNQQDDIEKWRQKLNELEQRIPSIQKRAEAWRELHKKNAEFWKKDLELTGKRMEIHLIDIQLSRLWLILKIGTPFGFLLSTVGFILWYCKIQRYLDITTKKKGQDSIDYV
jgi:hypothetical protein